MDSLNEIDSLFKEGEHQKELAISQDLKNRMNQELGASKNSKLKIYRYLGGIAAAFLVMALVFVGRPNESDYELEELTYEPHPVINITTINLLPPFVNRVYEDGFLKG